VESPIEEEYPTRLSLQLKQRRRRWSESVWEDQRSECKGNREESGSEREM